MKDMQFFRGTRHGREVHEFGRQSMGMGHHPHQHRHGGIEYYAVVSQSAMFWNGELPDIRFGRASMHRTYDGMIMELTQKVNDAVSEAMRFNRPLPPQTQFHDLQRRNPSKQIVAIRPTVRF
jgi:hypothetical protein